MTGPRLLLRRFVLDVKDFQRAATFWCAALGYDVVYKSDSFWVLRDAAKKRIPIGLQLTSDPKRDADPSHLELFTDDMEREAARLIALGATRPADWPYNDEKPNWIVMRDPDGHEFCVIEYPADRLDFS